MVIKFDKVLDDIKITDYNNRKIALSTQKGEPIRFQIPKMYMPFGISGFTPEIGKKKWNIDFSMRGLMNTRVLSNGVTMFFDKLKRKSSETLPNKVKKFLVRK